MDWLKGKVESANADIEGRFSGELVVHETLSIKGTSNITGDILIGKLSVEPGSNIQCNMCHERSSKKNSTSMSNKDSLRKNCLKTPDPYGFGFSNGCHYIYISFIRRMVRWYLQQK